MVMPITGGIGLATRRDGGPDAPSAADAYFADLVREAARRAWADYRIRLDELLQSQLGLGDRIAPGVTLYDIELEISPDIDLTVERDDAGDLVVHLLTGGSYIEATSTTPTDLGEWADPRFSFAFGLDLTYRIDLPPTNSALHATGFESIRVLSPKLDSHNFVADLAFVVNALVDWFGGPNYAGLLEQFIAATDFASYANDALTPLNDRLNELASEGYWFLEAVVDRLDGGSSSLHGLSLPGAPQGRLDLLLTVYGFDRSGAIEGVISWPRMLGAPTTGRPVDLRDQVAPELRPTRMSATTAAVLQSDRTHDWTALTTGKVALSGAEAIAPTGSGGSGAVAAAALPTGGSATSASADPADPASAAAEVAITTALTDLPSADRLIAARELRAGVADRFVSMIGGLDRFAELRAEFLRGRTDFVVAVTTPVGGAGLFADQRSVGTMASLWADDDESTYRRRYLVVDVAVDAPLTVTADLAPGNRWNGAVDQVVCQPSGWSGTVTVHPAPPRTPLAQHLENQVEVQLPDRSRIFGRSDELQERGIIIVGGRSEEVALNPQPLPPQAIDVGAGGFATERLSRDATVLQGPSSEVASLRADHTSGLSAEVSAALAGQVSRAGARQSARWGHEVRFEDDAAAVIAAQSFVRSDPSGAGVVKGIDFAVTEYHEPIVR